MAQIYIFRSYLIILNVPRFLVVAATKAEALPLLNQFSITMQEETGMFVNEVSPGNVSVLITGVGMVNTAYYMGRYAGSEFDHVINVGICGSFNRKIKIGEVVNVVSDTISEMGAETEDEFIHFAELNLGGTNIYHNRTRYSYKPLNSLKKVSGITVNTVHGNEESIRRVMDEFHPTVETMEGAAFLRCCETFKSYYQVRGVSNYVEKRDRGKWDIPLAINNVNEFVIKMIHTMEKV
jgi:futalosine hydrolase